MGYYNPVLLASLWRAHLLMWQLWQAQAVLAYLCTGIGGPCGLWSWWGGETAPRWRKEIAPSIHQDVDKVETKLLVRLQRLKALALGLGILWGEVLWGMTLCSAT